MNISLKVFTFLALPIILSNVSCNKDNIKPYRIESTVREITYPAFGNVDFNITQADIEEAGINYGDTIDLKMDNIKKVGNDYVVGQGGSYEFKNLPFVSNYNEVGYYAPCLCNYQKSNERFDISFGLNKIKNYAQEMVDNQIKCTFTLNKKGGYKDTLELVSCPTKLPYEKIDRNNIVYANFRDVASIGNIDSKIKTSKFFRGSSPFNAKKNDGPSDPRYLYADKLLGVNGITHEVSLSIDNSLDERLDVYPISKLFKDNIIEGISKTPNSAEIYGYVDEKSQGSNYGTNFISVGLGSDYFYDSPAHQGKSLTKQVFQFIATSSAVDDSKIYIHCDEGKDRTGFFSMVIEALCGVSYRDIVADFMCTFKNYFEFSRKDEAAKKKYDTMKLQTLCRHVYSICVDDPAVVDWPTVNAEEKLKEFGIIEDNESSGTILKTKAEEYIKRLFTDEPQKALDIITNIQTYIGK